MVAGLVFSLAACGKDKKDDSTTADTNVSETADLETNGTDEDQTRDEDQTVDADQTRDEDETDEDVSGEETTPAGEDSSETANTDTTAAPVDKKPGTKAEILAAYTAAMNKAKTDKPAFKRAEFQELPSGKDYRNITGGKFVIDPLLGFAGAFMTKEDKARKNPHVNNKGENMWAFPVKDAPKGCLLTDVNAIKDAKCVNSDKDGKANPNGDYYKITIVLKDEKNPEHYISGNTAPSNTGAMFMPLSKSDVDPELEKISAIKDAKYDMNYYNCTSTLVYNPKTMHVVSVDQVLYNKLEMSGKVLGLSASGWQVLIMHYQIFDVVY